MSNLDNWNKLSRPPVSALKTIQAGRLRGKSDINPQWRYQAMTEVYGECGSGWRYEIKRLWTESAPKEQVFCFAEVAVSVRTGSDWSYPIPGIGGSMLVSLEKEGLHANDEAYKMAVTDALSVALKMLGVASEIYLGNWDGSKYKEEKKEEPKLLTVTELEEKMTSAVNLFELKARYDKYAKDIEALKGEDRVKVMMAKDKRKVTLQDAEKKKGA